EIFGARLLARLVVEPEVGPEAPALEPAADALWRGVEREAPGLTVARRPAEHDEDGLALPAPEDRAEEADGALEERARQAGQVQGEVRLVRAEPRHAAVHRHARGEERRAAFDEQPVRGEQVVGGGVGRGG